ncbi:hypothetical protein I3760_01G177300 [Carya illinoinensis]|nr:hypothetical protein I3760_01G177300 [Carya illinoinensis]
MAAPAMSFTTKQYQQLISMLNSTSVKQTGSAALSANLAFSHSLSRTTCLSSSHYVSCPSTTWIIDTGASNHMINDPSLFTFVVPFCSLVKLPNNTSIYISPQGKVQLSPNLILLDVLCVPDFHFNLIFASRLSIDSHCCLVFLPSSHLIQDLTSKRMIGVCEEKDGL